MNLHVVAYPKIEEADYRLIQQYRKKHNGLYPIIEPHFTLVFSINDISAEDFVAEVKKQTADVKAIPFSLRVAMINRDAISQNYDAFLVPDEGYSGITKLHDRLYSELFAPHHRLDISYIPHLSIAYAMDARHILQIVNEWNAHNYVINGVINALDIMNYENRVVTTIERIELQRD